MTSKCRVVAGGRRMTNHRQNEFRPRVGPGDSHLAAHLFEPTRMTLARELRGLKKAELAAKINRTPSAISQFESGRARPDAQTLAALSLALRVPLAFFATPPVIGTLALDACHFRSLRSATQMDRRRLLASASITSELVNLLEEEVEMPSEQVSAVARMAHGADAIEECASEVRLTWSLGLGPIPNLVRLLESKGIVVAHVPEECREVDAFSTWCGTRPFIFLVSESGSASRMRFDSVHELGHLVMHADVAPGNAEAERDANRFASAFLLPKEPFLAECPRWLNFEHLYELKRRWGVSVAALVRRAYDLGVFSEATYRRAFVRLNKTGERYNERNEPAPEAPTLIAKALQALSGDKSLDELAGDIGLRGDDLRALLVSSGVA